MIEEIVLGLLFILNIIFLIKNKKIFVIVLTLSVSTIWNFIWMYRETLFYFEDIYMFLELTCFSHAHNNVQKEYISEFRQQY